MQCLQVHSLLSMHCRDPITNINTTITIVTVITVITIVIILYRRGSVS